MSHLDRARLEGYDAVINLAGENIAGARWSETQKKLIRESRVQSTSLLANTLSVLKSPPKVFISASAVGYYGNCGETAVNENTYPAKTFLAEVARDWEAATQPAATVGIRTVITRFAMVLSPNGGALPKMLPLFRLGLGGRLGSGQQYCSWIAIEDLVRAIQFLMDTPSASGAFNLTSPNPVTNAEFTKALGKALHRPTVFAVPGPVLRLALGQMAYELLLYGVRALPSRLSELGFRFELDKIEEALGELSRH